MQIIKILKPIGTSQGWVQGQVIEVEDNIATDLIAAGYAELYTGSGPGGTGEAVWGGITGSIDNQLDLKAKLANKVDKDGSKVLSTYDFNDSYKSLVNGAFQKATDTSDNITEGAVKLFLTTTERNKIASSFIKGTDTADSVLEGSNHLFLTTTERGIIGNQSGVNTGDETTSTILSKIGDGSKISSSYLPSFVDDVLEYANFASFPVTGESGKIYVDISNNLTYRWSGSAYVEISASLALGTTSSTAYRGDYGAIAYTHSQLVDGTNPHGTTFANIASKPTTVSGYGITDGVTLTGSQILTNKTLTAPVFNSEITGTGVTTTGEANKLIKVNSNGRVVLGGIDDGTSTFQIAGKASIYNTVNENYLHLKCFTSGLNTSNTLGFMKSKSNTANTLNATINSDILGNIGFFGVNNGATSYGAGVYLSAVQTGVAGSQFVPSKFTISTSDGTYFPTERVSVESDGSMKILSLAGTGNRTLMVDSTGKIYAA